MKIKTSDFVTSAVAPSQYPEGLLPEIALVGRSNVGKSSTINTMLGRKKLARISATPGKTRTINFFMINQEFYLVDLPGYGYAKVSKTEKASWGKTMETYLANRQNLQEVILLVDIRHEPTNDDKMMYDWLKHFGYGSIVIATKLDKISKSQLQKHLKIIRQKLQMEKEDHILPISSLKKQGVEEVWNRIETLFIERQLPITIEEAPK
ncbi:ribosome biogenesis GTP-binding protein YihA/YsxC [Clostridium formicaceticum]|uniref:Probable GTP-binding protein EngB n=1 Tax=Clostridium formicaceticum TaxID=1497 RepID=A0AAC9WEY8_9CLOT|nr:ribosome biogenesis GTP-binding protein YihA/YsxC [Clostridium formicaceticum]AOY75944.1 YihA family ribosome biogenesis GTP-binding protein [Clostridium formicaceticum]ARE86292.1 putative GTP-binding protein EngB [Clostridium formicaceticum]